MGTSLSLSVAPHSFGREGVCFHLPLLSVQSFVAGMSALKAWVGHLRGQQPPRAKLGISVLVDMGLALWPVDWTSFGAELTDLPWAPLIDRFNSARSSSIHDLSLLGPLAHLPCQSPETVGILSRNWVGVVASRDLFWEMSVPYSLAGAQTKPHPS